MNKTSSINEEDIELIQYSQPSKLFFLKILLFFIFQAREIRSLQEVIKLSQLY